MRLLARRDGLVRQTLDKDALAVRGLADPIMPRCNIQPPPRNPYDAACDTPQTTLRHALRRVRPRPALLWDGRSCCPLRRHAAGHAATTPRARGKRGYRLSAPEVLRLDAQEVVDHLVVDLRQCHAVAAAGRLCMRPIRIAEKARR